MNEKWTSAGGVVLPHTGEWNQCYLVAPSGGYGGYTWTFPKGRVDDGESHETAALREVKEEAGLDAKIILPQPIARGVGTMSVTFYYMMRANGTPGTTDYETADVKLVTFEEARGMLDSSRDLMVLSNAEKWCASQGQEQNMNEGMNFLGKLFFASIAAWVIGKATGLKIKGTPAQINAVKNAMFSSKRFQQELSRPGATVDDVMNRLNLKHASAKEFEKILGIKWPL